MSATNLMAQLYKSKMPKIRLELKLTPVGLFGRKIINLNTIIYLTLLLLLLLYICEICKIVNGLVIGFSLDHDFVQ